MQKISIDFWDSEWKRQDLGKGIKQRINNQLLYHLRPALRHGSKILEVGCVPAGRLSFLKSRYSVTTYGLDFSMLGLLQSIKSDNFLVCADLFQSPFKAESFDLVYSLGVVEHFEDPRKAVKVQIDLVKKGGLVLITIPNFHPWSFASLAYRIARRYNEIKRTHNMSIMNAPSFRRLFDKLSLEALICDFYGPITTYSPPKAWLRRISDKVNLSLDRVGVRSRVFSPDLVFIGRKL